LVIRHPREPKPLRNVIIAWMLGPAAYGAFEVHVAVCPEAYDPPGLALLVVPILAVGHVISAIAAIAMACVGRHYRRLIELWLLLAYLAGTAASVAVLVLGSKDKEGMMIWLVCRYAALLLVAAVPLAALVRTIAAAVRRSR
jgi:hypothetical protein